MMFPVRYLYALVINILIVCVVGASAAYSQEAKLLYEIMRQKNNEVLSPHFTHIKRISYYPDTIPSWFFNPPLSSSDEYFAVGVSDPDMTRDSAMVQAIERAKGMIALQFDSKIQYFRDIYNIERVSGKYTLQGQKYDTYYKISSNIPFYVPSLAVLDSHFTRYNEQIVLVKYSLPNKTEVQDAVEAKASIVRLEFNLNNVFELQEEYDVYFFADYNDPAKNVQTSYNYRLRDWHYNFTSTTQSKVHTYPSYSYKYYGPNEYDSTIIFTSYPGLWAGLTRGWMREMTTHAEAGRKFVRSIGDSYSPKSENIVRETSRIRGSFGFQGARLRDDKIQVNLLFLDAFEKFGDIYINNK
ncbi:hypothetical protein [Williamwhitmania taraxaci]|uniref:Uncharacterized protein n=1 Tax=Williamwhitmania taraxaci TaxID=1640674 RepID=A0A1G6IUH9_9BACT|nr:hypothetical protein [Williamwhitmania taraxaci]SDC10148.1 hypothetical protein SAMN05216323_101732 [Williamwhitmania taraxaci]